MSFYYWAIGFVVGFGGGWCLALHVWGKRWQATIGGWKKLAEEQRAAAEVSERELKWWMSKRSR